VAASALLEQSLATLMACSTALGSVNSTWTRGGVTELVRAEAWRASCLSVSTRLLRGELELAAASNSIARLIDAVLDSFSAESRVRGIDLDADAIPRSLHAPVDAQILSAAVANAVFLTIGALDGLSASQIKVAVSVENGSLSIVVSQQHAGVPSVWPTRVFEEGWTNRPGGDMSYVAAVTMRAAVKLHGGTFALAGGARSTRITITFPTSAV
jgi:signal transduction histidine kinase